MSWTAALLQDALRHIFQRVIVEPHPEIQDLAEQVVHNLILCAFCLCELSAFTLKHSLSETAIRVLLIGLSVVK
jgi:hypothetical protein